MNEQNEHIGRNIRLVRTLSEMTQAELAKALAPPTTQQQICMWEKSCPVPKAESLEAIAVALRVPSEDLLDPDLPEKVRTGGLPSSRKRKSPPRKSGWQKGVPRKSGSQVSPKT